MKIFIGFTIEWSEEDREVVIAHVLENFSKVFQQNVVVYDCKQVFQDVFPDCEGWDGYIDHVSVGRDFYSRKPNFDILILPQRQLGRVTAQISQKFLEQKKPVLFLERIPTWTYQNVTEVVTLDDENWKQGWSITCS